MIDLRGHRPKVPEEFRDSRPASTKARRVHSSITNARREIATKVADGEELEDFPDHWKKAREPIARAQHQKCVYCETRVRPGYPGDVEHYRPKEAVTPVSWNRAKKQFRDGKKITPGYWWLAYSFDNYLFSCFWCNNRKGTRFPVRGQRPPLTPGSEPGERPLLLNPFMVDPSIHLEFDELGGVHGMTQEGRFTIHVCGLDRHDLHHERQRIATTITRDIDDYEDAVVADNELAQQQTLRRLLEACLPDAPYAAMARALVYRRLQLSYEELLAARDAGLLDS